MNIFRGIGDLMHLASFIIIFLKIRGNMNCRGISLKTQELYALTFVCRYLDLAWNFLSMYNWIMKVIFISASMSIVYLIRYHPMIRQSYQKDLDKFQYEWLVAFCAILAMIFIEFYSISEYLWTFSIYLEAVAIIPQLIVVHYQQEHHGFIDNITSDYVFTLGGYRAMYLLNWVYRYFTEPGYRNWIVWISGFVQTAIFGDFLYYYVKCRMQNKPVALPI